MGLRPFWLLFYGVFLPRELAPGDQNLPDASGRGPVFSGDVPHVPLPEIPNLRRFDCTPFGGAWQPWRPSRSMPNGKISPL
jgi:hypothetical protein